MEFGKVVFNFKLLLLFIILCVSWYLQVTHYASHPTVFQCGRLLRSNYIGWHAYCMTLYDVIFIEIESIGFWLPDMTVHSPTCEECTHLDNRYLYEYCSFTMKERWMQQCDRHYITNNIRYRHSKYKIHPHHILYFTGRMSTTFTTWRLMVVENTIYYPTSLTTVCLLI